MGYKDLMEKQVDEAKNDAIADPIKKMKNEIVDREKQIISRLGRSIDNFEKGSSNYDNLGKRMLNYILSLIVDIPSVQKIASEGVGGSKKIVKKSDTIIKINDKPFLLADLRSMMTNLKDELESVTLKVLDEDEKFMSDELSEKMDDMFDNNTHDEICDFLELKDMFKEYEIKNPHFLFVKTKDKIANAKGSYKKITGEEYEFPVEQKEHRVVVKDLVYEAVDEDATHQVPF